MRHRIQVTCPMCGKEFAVELEVGTYVTVESSTPAKHRTALILRGREAKLDFVLRAMKALASKDPGGSVEKSEIIELAQKVGLSQEEVDQILKEEISAGRIYEAKPGVLRFVYGDRGKE